MCTVKAALHPRSPHPSVWDRPHSISSQLGLANYYTTACLQKASGGASGAFLDFAQVHTYPTSAHGTQYNPTSPFRHNASEFGLTKPLVVGEFQPGKGRPTSAVAQYQSLHSDGYDGAWGWTAADQPTLFDGMATLRAQPDVARVVLPHAGLKDTCNCSDTSPNAKYTCVQQSSWGKCSEHWMHGFCCRSCHACSASCTSAAAEAQAIALEATPASRLATARIDVPWQPDWAHADYRAFVESAQRRARARAQQSSR